MLSANCCKICLEIPSTQLKLYPGQIVRLSRFDAKTWRVGYGWFSFSGNREMCGWYLTSENDEVKPLLLIDLDDIYFVS